MGNLSTLALKRCINCTLKVINPKEQARMDNIETNENTNESLDFIRAEIAKDINEYLNDGRVHTRFPPRT